MVPVVRAERDASLVARVVSQAPLLYAAGAARSEDRPAHVRAGSGIAALGRRLAVIQDDTNVVALLGLPTPEVDFVLLPTGVGGLRQFDDVRGNKHHKLDLEACFAETVDGREALIALGSGSTAARERLVVVFGDGGGGERIRLVEASSFYASLRASKEFSGSELNIEGAVRVGDCLRLFQRGNGEARDGRLPVDATADVRWAEFESLLTGRDRSVSIHDVVQYDLGNIGGVRLTFTDAATHPSGALLYLATAEASPDAVRDGPVAGTALGVMNAGGVRWTPLTDARGMPLGQKAEGLVVSQADPARAFVVLDADDPQRPSELCDVALEGPW